MVRQIFPRISSFALCLVALVPMAKAAAGLEFVVTGQSLTGEIIRSTGAIVVIKLDNGAMISTPPNSISSVTIDVRELGVIRGRFVSWQDGVYRLEGETGEVLVDPGGFIEELGRGGPDVSTPDARDAGPATPATLLQNATM